MIILETFSFLSFFAIYGIEQIAYLAAMAVVFSFFLYWGERESRGEMENALKFKFFKFVKPMLSKLASALVLLGVLLSLPKVQNNEYFFDSKSILDISGWTAALTQKIYPDFKKEDTIDSIAKKLAESQLKSDPNFEKLSVAGREMAVDKAAGEILNNFTAQSGVEIENNGTFQSAIFHFITTKLKGWHNAAPTTFLFVWAALLFFIFRGFGTIAVVFVGGIAYVLLELLFSMNIVHLTGESRIHESVEFS